MRLHGVCLRIVSFLMTAVLLAACPVSALPEAEKEAVRLVCLNIGKADCLLLLYGDRAFLIDAGYEQSWPAIRMMLSQYQVSRLEGVFLTHCHKDHYGALDSLANSDIAVDAWYSSSVFYDVKPSKHPAVLAASVRGESVTWLNAGDRISAGDASFTVLGPLWVNQDNENNNSLVMRFDSPQGSILLTGDMKSEEEKALAAAGLFSHCEILKCGHHGDSKATGSVLIHAVSPAAAVICTAAGEEKDTPSAALLKRLKNTDCQVYVTQDSADALELSLSNHLVSARDVSWDGTEPRLTGLSMRMDPDQDLLYVTNSAGTAAVIADAVIYSSKGTDLYSLPKLTIPPKGTVVIGSRDSGSGCDYYLESKKHIWHREALDIAVLYDALGRPLAWADNGRPDD